MVRTNIQCVGDTHLPPLTPTTHFSTTQTRLPPSNSRMIPPMALQKSSKKRKTKKKRSSQVVTSCLPRKNGEKNVGVRELDERMDEEIAVVVMSIMSSRLCNLHAPSQTRTNARTVTHPIETLRTSPDASPSASHGRGLYQISRLVSWRSVFAKHVADKCGCQRKWDPRCVCVCV